MAYTSMVFAYLKMSYVPGVLTDFELIHSSRVAFQQDTVVNFWRGARQVYLRDTFSSDGRRFARLIDGVYAEVDAAPWLPPRPSERRDAVSGNTNSTPMPKHRAVGVAIAVGVSVGVVWQAVGARRQARLSGRKDHS